MIKTILVIALALLVLGVIVIVALQMMTGLFHVFKKEDPPGENDSNWNRDQAKEAK